MIITNETHCGIEICPVNMSCKYHLNTYIQEIGKLPPPPFVLECLWWTLEEKWQMPILTEKNDLFLITIECFYSTIMYNVGSHLQATTGTCLLKKFHNLGFLDHLPHRTGERFCHCLLWVVVDFPCLPRLKWVS